MSVLEGMKTIALQRLDEEDPYFLILWWCNKYKLPNNHPLLLQKTWEELYIDYLTDCFANDPEQLRIEKEKLLPEKQVWKGETTESYEKEVKKMLAKMPKVDLSQWQDIKKGNDEVDNDLGDSNDKEN